MQKNLIWDEWTGGWRTVGEILFNAEHCVGLRMKLCRKYPDSLVWMGGYVKEI